MARGSYSFGGNHLMGTHQLFASRERVNHERDHSLAAAEDLYVDEKHRRCSMGASPNCCGYTDEDGVARQHVGNMRCFYYRTKENSVLTCCRTCSEVIKQNRIAKRQAAAADDLASTMGKLIRRPLMSVDLPTYADHARELLNSMGGIDSASKMVGTRYKQILEDDNQRAREWSSVGKQLTDMVANLQKLSPDPLDFSQMSDEEIIALIAPAARQYALSSPDFRRELLNDPEIREALLLEDGVEVIEVDRE